MTTITAAVALVFAMGFATRAIDDHWKDPDKFRILYMMLGLMVGAIGYLITFAEFRLASLPLDTGLFFIYMLSIDCLAAIAALLGMKSADWLQEKIISICPPI